MEQSCVLIAVVVICIYTCDIIVWSYTHHRYKVYVKLMTSE